MHEGTQAPGEGAGAGQVTGVDIPGETRGVLPSTDWKRATYKRPEQQKWYGGETISLGIGQGYNAYTPLQLAVATATLANAAKLEDVAPYPKAEDGFVRQVINLPKQAQEDVTALHLPRMPTERPLNDGVRGGCLPRQDAVEAD